MRVTPRYERWQTLLIAPGDLLRLLRHAATGASLHLPELPPDVALADAGFDTRQGCFLLVLESAFFPEVPVQERDGVLSGPWEETTLSFEDNPTPTPLTPVTPPAGVPVPWEAYLLDPDEVLALLRALAGSDRVDAVSIPPDARAVDAFYNPERRAFILVLESDLFAPARPHQVGAVTHLTLPERVLNFKQA